MITPDQLGGDEDLARRVLVRARDIAPCIASFPDDSEEQKDAIAILRAVVAEIPAPGSSRIRSKSRNGTAVSFTDPGSWFSDDDLASLRSLCGAGTLPGLPIGSFPEGRHIEQVWPEGRYT